MNDDFSVDLTGTKPQTLVEEAWHVEQKRKQYDIYRAINPTPKDIYIQYDLSQYQRFPANSKTDVPRYIFERYLVHAKDEIINDMAQKKHDEDMESRRTKGMPEFTSKYEENIATWNASNYPKTNDPVLVEQIMDTLHGGLVHEFGRDKLPGEVDPRSGEVDLTPVEQKIFDKFNQRKVVDDNSPAIEVPVPVVTPQSVVTPVTADFSALQDTLDKKLSVEEITNE